VINEKNVSTSELLEFISGDLVTNFLNHPLNNCNHIHFGTNFKNVVVRIFEGKLRVRDFSLNNLELGLIGDTLEFRFIHKGLENNHIHFSDTSTVHYDYEREMLLVHVNGNVYYKDNTRRYDEFHPYDLELHDAKIKDNIRYQQRVPKHRRRKKGADKKK